MRVIRFTRVTLPLAHENDGLSSYDGLLQSDAGLVGFVGMATSTSTSTSRPADTGAVDTGAASSSATGAEIEAVRASLLEAASRPRINTNNVVMTVAGNIRRAPSTVVTWRDWAAWLNIQVAQARLGQIRYEQIDLSCTDGAPEIVHLRSLGLEDRTGVGNSVAMQMHRGDILELYELLERIHRGVMSERRSSGFTAKARAPNRPLVSAAVMAKAPPTGKGMGKGANTAVAKPPPPRPHVLPAAGHGPTWPGVAEPHPEPNRPSILCTNYPIGSNRRCGCYTCRAHARAIVDNEVEVGSVTF